MRRSNAGLIGGLLCTVALVAGLVIAGLAGGGGDERAVGATPAAAGLPQTGCIPVAAHDGTSRAAGCVLASDQYAPPPVYDKLMARHQGDRAQQSADESCI